MKKKLYILFALAICALLIRFSVAETDFSFLDTMSLDELEALYETVVSRITIARSGDPVYSEDGISIIWRGIKKDDDSGQFSFLISNTTGRDYTFMIADGGINGLLLGPHWNMERPNLNNGLSMLTTSSNNWLFDWETVEALGISHADTIYLDLELVDSNTDELRKISISFAVNEDLPQE